MTHNVALIFVSLFRVWFLMICFGDVDYTLNPLSAAYEEEIQGNDAILLFSPEDSMQSRPPVAIGAHVDLMVHSSTVDGLVDEALPEASTFEDLSDWDTCPMSVAIVDDGSYLDIDAYVHCLQYAGRKHLRLVTLLDQPSFSKAFRQMHMPYMHTLYFWHCYEICRRVAQTSLVVLIELLLNTAVSHVYAVTFAFCAVCCHLHYLPFKDRKLQSLQTCILCNQFLVQLGMMFCFWNTDDGVEFYADVILISLQVVFMLHCVVLVIPTSSRLMFGIVDKLRAFFAVRFAFYLQESASNSQRPIQSQDTMHPSSSFAMTRNHVVEEVK
eukprot:gene13926-16463_t